MSVFTFQCPDCRHITRKYSAWRKHLLEESHQIHARERSKNWTIRDARKAVVVFGLISIKSSDVLKHFGNLAFLADLVFWNERRDFCILQFLTTTFRENISSDQHIINAQKLFLRRREEITEEEWFSICPLGSLTVKLEMDLGDNGTSSDPFSDTSDEDEQTQNEESLTSSAASEEFQGSMTSQGQRLSSRLRDRSPVVSNSQSSLNGYYTNNIEVQHLSTIPQISVVAEAQLQQNFTPIPPIPAAAVLDNGNSVQIRKKPKKLQPFVIQLEISKEFRNMAKAAKRPRMKRAIEENLSAVWRTFLTDFNKIVWPLCFGVELTPIPMPEQTADGEETNFKIFGQPCKGILSQPNMIRWTITPQAEQDLERTMTRLFHILKTTKRIPSVSGIQIDPSQSQLSFECKILVNSSSNEARKHARERSQARIEFTDVRGSVTMNKHRKRLTTMYTELWTKYSIHRLLSSDLDSLI